jgi:hypothetical protein
VLSSAGCSFGGWRWDGLLLRLRAPVMLLLLREAVGLALCSVFPRLAYDRFDITPLRCYTPTTKMTSSYARAHKCLAALSHQLRGGGAVAARH